MSRCSGARKSNIKPFVRSVEKAIFPKTVLSREKIVDDEQWCPKASCKLLAASKAWSSVCVRATKYQRLTAFLSIKNSRWPASGWLRSRQKSMAGVTADEQMELDSLWKWFLLHKKRGPFPNHQPVFTRQTQRRTNETQPQSLTYYFLSFRM